MICLNLIIFELKKIGPEKFFKQYNYDDSEILNMMQVYKNGKYSKNNFLYSTLIKPSNQL